MPESADEVTLLRRQAPPQASPSQSHHRTRFLPSESAILRSCNAAVAPRARRNEKDPLMATATGTIKRLTDKGFGFIAASDGVEYFFHQSACQGTRFDDLREGQRVSFDIGQGPKGPRAENVKPA